MLARSGRRQARQFCQENVDEEERSSEAACFLLGMSRRIDSYFEGFGFEFWNFVISIGAFVSTRNYMKVKADGTYVNRGSDPWDARSLEWMIPSPAPEHNFDEDIEIHGLDEFRHRIYGYNENHRVMSIATAEQVAQNGVNTNAHLPSPSYWPIRIAIGPPIIGYGLFFNLWLCALCDIIGGGIFGFALEPPDDPYPHGHHDDNTKAPP